MMDTSHKEEIHKNEYTTSGSEKKCRFCDGIDEAATRTSLSDKSDCIIHACSLWRVIERLTEFVEMQRSRDEKARKKDVENIHCWINGDLQTEGRMP
jgi:hypothetical protein